MTKWTSEQLDAIEKYGQNIVVSAGAGSGKTAVLTARVLNKIENGININELLILTFTNAAAKEMKDRIRKELKDNNLQEQLNLIDGSFITTFDSFALSLVKKYHYLLNISPSVSIADSSIILLEKEHILDQIFNQMYQDKNEKFLKLINDFCIKDDKEIRNYILNIDDKLNLKIDKIKYLEEIDYYYTDSFINKQLDSYLDLIKEKINEIFLILDEIKIVSDETFFSKLEEVLVPLKSSNSYEQIKNSIDIKLPNLPKNSDVKLSDLKKNISNILKSIKEMCNYDNITDFKEDILLTCDYVTIISKIIIELENQINSFKLKNELFEFNDIIKMAINVIENNESVKEDVKKTFKEIMVDEYQDTSDLQEYFINLIENNNVYMVGDIKQSIYRFRNANPKIFRDKYEKYLNNQGGIKIDLNKNFRSRSEVVSNINLLFNLIMDQKLGGASYKENHQMVFGNQDYENNKPLQNYNMEVLEYDFDKQGKYSKEEIELFTICQNINDKINNGYLIYDRNIKDYRKCCYSDFSILVDRATSFVLAKKIFEYMHIPLFIYIDESITESYDVMVIHNIIKLILKEKNKEYDKTYTYLFMSIARSFLFSYDDDKIFNTIKNNQISDDIIIKKIRSILENIESKTISQIYFEILKEFEFYENITRLGNVLDSTVKLEYLNNVCISFEKLGYTITEFEEYLENVINKGYDIKLGASKGNSNSVKIMTIHKSKGLEFPICYYIGLDKAFNLKDIKDRFLYSNKYGIITPYFRNGIGKTIYIDLLKNDYLEEEISEKIRLFYVALTRAKEKMIFVMPTNLDKSSKEYSLDMRKNYRCFADIVYSISEFLGTYKQQIDLSSIKLSKDYNKFKEYKKFISDSKERIIFKEHINENIKLEENKFSKTINELIDENTHKNMEFGLLFHECLEYLDFKNPNYDKLKNEFIKNKIKKFINLLCLKDSKIYKELEFMYKENNAVYHGIIDLLIEYDNNIDIIDYKLKNIVDDNYKKQLLGYKKYISKISNKDINIYLYSILDEELKKIDI